MLSRLNTVGFWLLAAGVTAAPWFFGAWEMWWFWTFLVLLSLAFLLLGASLLGGESVSPSPAPVAGSDPEPNPVRRRAILTLVLAVPFFVYALIRTLQAPVFATAERSLLLLASPVALAVAVVAALDAAQLRRLHALLVVDLLLLGVYGIVNHWVTDSRLVLWAPAYEMYLADHRASGSYFCPDHFAGAMELLLCVGLGLMLPRLQTWRQRWTGLALSAVALLGIVLSKSRGGGLTALLVLLGASVLGFSQWPALPRWCYRISAVSAVGIAVILFLAADTGYMRRFNAEFGWAALENKPLGQATAALFDRLKETSRGRMIGGALRAWRDHEVFGVGPGMHQHVWPHYAATRDGDRERRVWPSQPNYEFHSYEVHSDWVQLIEEYGLAGLLLFLLPAGAGCLLLHSVFRLGLGGRDRSRWAVPPADFHPATLGAVLALGAMAFHSLGDFNLQMPATTWLLSCIVAVPVAMGCGHRPPPANRERRRRRQVF